MFPTPTPSPRSRAYHSLQTRTLTQWSDVARRLPDAPMAWRLPPPKPRQLSTPDTLQTPLRHEVRPDGSTWVQGVDRWHLDLGHPSTEGLLRALLTRVFTREGQVAHVCVAQGVNGRGETMYRTVLVAGLPSSAVDVKAAPVRAELLQFPRLGPLCVATAELLGRWPGLSKDIYEDSVITQWLGLPRA